MKKTTEKKRQKVTNVDFYGQNDDTGINYYKCNNCNYRFLEYSMYVEFEYNFCPKCGIKLKWEIES